MHVVYGLIGLKTHCKVALVVRREGEGIRRYVHLGTGNYNPQTARQYTDLSLFTVARREIAEDVARALQHAHRLRRAAAAGSGWWWRRSGSSSELVELIEREAERARRGEPARIVAKMNSLVDAGGHPRALRGQRRRGVRDRPARARHLLPAARACPGVSEQHPGHARSSTASSSTAASSPSGRRRRRRGASSSRADWMPRNFHRRVEVMFPVEEPALKARLVDEVLGAALADDAKARRLLPDGRYERPAAERPARRSQEALLAAARQAAGEPGNRPPLIRPVPVPVPPQ